MKTIAMTTFLALCACTPPAADTPATVYASQSAILSTALNAPAGRQSRYTSLTDCTVTLAKPDEAGYSASDCSGLDGFAIQKIEADGRENLSIQPPQGRSQSLRLPEYGSGGFSVLGEQVEWRGEPDAPPDALIIRYKVVEKAEEPDHWTSYLMIASLKPIPCVVAKVAPGPQQNENARNAADGDLACLPVR